MFYAEGQCSYSLRRAARSLLYFLPSEIVNVVPGADNYTYFRFTCPQKEVEGEGEFLSGNSKAYIYINQMFPLFILIK